MIAAAAALWLVLITAPANLPAPSQTSPANLPAPSQTSPAHLPAPSQTSPANLPAPSQTSPAHLPAPSQTSPANLPAPSRTSPAIQPVPPAQPTPRTQPAPLPLVPILEVSLAPTRPTVGDHVEAVLTLRVPAAALAGEPRFPVFRDSWGEAEIVAKGEPVRDAAAAGGGLATWRQRLVLAAFRPGRIALPPVAAAVPEKAGTVQATTRPDLGFEVRSVLPAGAKDAKLRPPAPLRSLPIGAAFWWTLAALGLLAGAGAWALLRRRAPGGAAARAAVPPAAPYPELIAELDRLSGEGSPLLVHTRLSFSLRRYLGRTLELPATESTTTEIHRLLHGRRVPQQLVRRTIELLRACDLVKFARQEVGVDNGRQRLAAARAIAGELEEMLRPQPQAAPPPRLEAVG
jgi:hypothetical protein